MTVSLERGILLVVAVVLGALLLRKALARLLLSRAKHRSLAGHPRWARRLSRWLPG